jgi:hypothetical protein
VFYNSIVEYEIKNLSKSFSKIRIHLSCDILDNGMGIFMSNSTICAQDKGCRPV